MKTLLKIILVLIIIAAIPFIAALFVNGEYAVEREITINQPKTKVFEYLKYLKNQDNFSVWSKIDPNMEKDFSGTDGEVGAINYWDSKSDSVGKGEQEIIAIQEGERIDFELRFFRPFEATDNAYFTTQDAGNNTTLVQWGFDGEMPYPMNLMLLFMDMEKNIAPALETGLSNLKELLETKAAPIEITQEEVTSQDILYISDSSVFVGDSISAKLGGAYGEIMSFMLKAGMNISGAPMAICNEFSMEKSFYSFDAAVPFSGQEVTLTGRVKAGKSYAGKVVKGIHLGAYENMEASYLQIDAYIKENGLEHNGKTWESYQNDPQKVAADSLITYIYYPIK